MLTRSLENAVAMSEDAKGSGMLLLELAKYYYVRARRLAHA